MSKEHSSDEEFDHLVSKLNREDSSANKHKSSQSMLNDRLPSLKQQFIEQTFESEEKKQNLNLINKQQPGERQHSGQEFGHQFQFSKGELSASQISGPTVSKKKISSGTNQIRKIAKKRIKLEADEEEYQPRQNLDQPIGKKRQSFIFSESIKDKLYYQGNQFCKNIGGHEFWFPYEKLNEPQKKFIEKMFECQDSGQNLLIESPTGTGKTLSLLIGSLAWAEQQYQKGGDYTDQIKIIYTSRAHSQLVQIQKQLKKTCYRPRMMIFGSKEKTCVNQDIHAKIPEGKKMSYDWWTKECHQAVNSAKGYRKAKASYKKQIERRGLHQQTYSKLMEKVARGEKLSEIQKMTLDNQQHFQPLQQPKREDFKSCRYYHEYEKQIEKAFNAQLGRELLTLDVLKEKAKNRRNIKGDPEPLCPYYYPKRAKYFADIYLMPYPYLLDSNILKHSEGLIRNSIIIFDEGHNVSKTACDGFSIQLKPSALRDQIYRMTGREGEIQIDDEERNLEFLNDEKLESQRKQSNANDQKIESNKRLRPEGQLQGQPLQKQNQEGSRKDRYEVPVGEINFDSTKKASQKKQVEKLLTDLLGCVEKNYLAYFQAKELDHFKRPDKATLAESPEMVINVDDDSLDPAAQNSTGWRLIRVLHTSKRDEMYDHFEKVFFPVRIQHYQNLTMRDYLSVLIAKCQELTNIRKSQGAFFLRISAIHDFFKRIQDVLFNRQFHGKFYLLMQQSKRIDKDKKVYFKGHVEIRCVSPEFAFKSIQTLGPRSIIVTSGTLSPMKNFEEEVKIKFHKQRTGHVITNKSILVRQLGVDSVGRSLEMSSTFFNQSEYSRSNESIPENMLRVLRLVLEIIKKVPNGVLVVLPSFSALYQLKTAFYDKFKLPNKKVREEILKVKKNVFFESKVHVQKLIDKYIPSAESDEGALLFCVCRAKLSEGIDFKDKLCRCVIFLGIPHVTLTDPFVIEKKNYLKSTKAPHAKQWHYTQVSKAINQALGRAVRHQFDFGSILLIDNRYVNPNQNSLPVLKHISSWIREAMSTCESVEQLQQDLDGFFKDRMASESYAEFDDKQYRIKLNENGKLTF